MREVRAFLASGNVIFAARRHQQDLADFLQRGLSKALDYEVPVFLRSEAEVRSIAEAQPFPEAELKRSKGKLQVAFLQQAPSASASRKARSLAPRGEYIIIEDRTLYWLPKAGLSESELDMRELERTVGSMTIRTHRTVTRLVGTLT